MDLVHPVLERPHYILFLCLRNNQHCWASAYPFKPYPNTAGKKERKREPWSFMQPQGTDVSSSHAKKNPPERDAEVALIWQFPAVQVHFIKWDARKVCRLQWRSEKGLDKMLRWYRERQRREKSMRKRQICNSQITRKQSPPVVHVCVYINSCCWWFLSLRFGISC